MQRALDGCVRRHTIDFGGSTYVLYIIVVVTNEFYRTAMMSHRCQALREGRGANRSRNRSVIECERGKRSVLYKATIYLYYEQLGPVQVILLVLCMPYFKYIYVYKTSRLNMSQMSSRACV